MAQADLPIPSAYFALAAQKRKGGLKNGVDQFGLPLETELNILYRTQAEILAASASLADDFAPDEDAPDDEGAENAENARLVRSPIDFEQLLNFGLDGAGSHFCMDFSQGGPPRIIFWDDALLAWRVIAQDVQGFFDLFD